MHAGHPSLSPEILDMENGDSVEFVDMLTAAEKPVVTAMGDMTGVPEATAASAVPHAVRHCPGIIS